LWLGPRELLTQEPISHYHGKPVAVWPFPYGIKSPLPRTSPLPDRRTNRLIPTRSRAWHASSASQPTTMTPKPTSLSHLLEPRKFNPCKKEKPNGGCAPDSNIGRKVDGLGNSLCRPLCGSGSFECLVPAWPLGGIGGWHSLPEINLTACTLPATVLAKGNRGRAGEGRGGEERFVLGLRVISPHAVADIFSGEFDKATWQIHPASTLIRPRSYEQRLIRSTNRLHASDMMVGTSCSPTPLVVRGQCPPGIAATERQVYVSLVLQALAVLRASVRR